MKESVLKRLPSNIVQHWRSTCL